MPKENYCDKLLTFWLYCCIISYAMHAMSGEATKLTEMPPGARSLHLLRKWILEGRFPGGTRLPPEQELAAEIGVSRGTVRLALDKLEREGLIKGRKGRGRLVVPGVAQAGSIMSRTVGLLTILPQDATRFRFSGWMEAVDAGIIEAATRAGLNVLTLHPDALGEEGLRRLILDRPFGVLVAHAVGENPWGPPILERLHRGGVRIVVNGDAPELAAYDRVVSDHEAGSYELTRWLIRRGRRRVLRLWTAGLDDYWVKARFAGHERALREAGLDVLPLVHVKNFYSPKELDREAFEIGTRQFAGFLVEHLRGPSRIDAVMVVSDPDVFQAAAALELLGVKPNADVDVVGYDNNWRDCPARRYSSFIPLATIDKLNHQTGEMMVRMLLEAGQAPQGAQGRRVVVQPRLIEISQSDAIASTPCKAES